LQDEIAEEVCRGVRASYQLSQKKILDITCKMANENHAGLSRCEQLHIFGHHVVKKQSAIDKVAL